jgi:hypothetical protein
VLITRRGLFELAGLLALTRPAAAPGRGDRAADEVARRAADVIRGYSAEGVHRTATLVDKASGDRLLALARATGTSASLQPFELSRVDPASSFLEIGGQRFEGLPMFDGAFTNADGVRGAIGAAVSDRPFDSRLAQDRPIVWTSVSPNAEVELRKTRLASTARAIVAVTAGQRPGLCPINAAYFTEPFGPPVLQIGSEQTAAVEHAVQSGSDVRVVAHANRSPATAFNIAAEVRGTQPALPPVCVMTPRSGWYRNASERGGGIACWLEALREVVTKRPLRTVKFVASSGHELGHLGLHAYLERNPALAHEALMWVHLGANIGTSTGPTVMSCSDDRAEAAALRALAAHGVGDLPRSPAAQVGGEALTISRANGRFISFIGRNVWFHNPLDVWPDVVDVQAVARFARAVSDLTMLLANAPAA